jgi:hypothetical protein
MNLKRRIALARWLLVLALLGSALCASRGATLIYCMRPTADVSLFRPSSAEAVSRKAEPFQSDTRETKGLFRIVQEQHVELAMIFSRLETAAELNWSLAVVGTIVLALMSCAFAASLALVLSIERRVSLDLGEPATGISKAG